MLGKLVCAWCNRKIRHVVLITGSVSHGICPNCLLRVFGYTPQELADRDLAHKQAEIARKKELRRVNRENKRRRG